MFKLNVPFCCAELSNGCFDAIQIANAKTKLQFRYSLKFDSCGTIASSKCLFELQGVLSKKGVCARGAFKHFAINRWRSCLRSDC